jgi:hypothetical protein
MADTIVDGTLFNSNSIKYTAPKANASGGKSINILNKATNTGLRLSTPLMLTWGASDFEGNGKFEFALQFPNDDNKNEDTEAFLKNMTNFENKIKSDALTYSKEWFGKQHKSSEVVDALWTPMLKYPKNKISGESDMTKNPSLRVKVPLWEGVWRCEIYDEDGNKMFPNPAVPSSTPLDFLQKGTNIACLLQCGGLWFANGKFGITWKLVQAVGQKPRATLSGQCFIKLNKGDKDRLKNSQPPPEPQDPEDVVATIVNDSDDEEMPVVKEPEPVVVPPPAPVPTPAPVVESVPPEPPIVVKKKVVKKKET